MRTNLVGREMREYRFLIGIFAILAGTSMMYGGSELTATREGSTSMEIQLENDQPIAGLQFVLTSSSDVVLQEIHNSGRTAGANWTVASNRVNDSTLNVVIVSTDMSYFSDGSGSIAELTISKKNTQTMSESISFTHVVAADPQANLVDVTASVVNLGSQNVSSAISNSDFSFGQNFPNPFNPSTRIGYELKRDAQVSLIIFDITGREVSRLVDQYQAKGTYTVTWNSSESRMGQLASGTYFARLQVGASVVTHKLLLTK